MDMIFTLSSFPIIFVNDKGGEELFVYYMHGFLQRKNEASKKYFKKLSIMDQGGALINGERMC